MMGGRLGAGRAEAHRNQVIHGDLKSSNIILTTGPDGAIRAVITDFGLARGMKAPQSGLESAALAGTPDYMAPELFRTKKSRARRIFMLWGGSFFSSLTAVG